MTEEPYRWLEAISNRREYIRDQLKGGTPVFALSRPEGILLLGVKCLACLGDYRNRQDGGVRLNVSDCRARDGNACGR